MSRHSWPSISGSRRAQTIYRQIGCSKHTNWQRPVVKKRAEERDLRNPKGPRRTSKVSTWRSSSAGTTPTMLRSVRSTNYSKLSPPLIPLRSFGTRSNSHKSDILSGLATSTRRLMFRLVRDAARSVSSSASSRRNSSTINLILSSSTGRQSRSTLALRRTACQTSRRANST